MISILMLDLGKTLVTETTVFPHAIEALEVLSKFKTSAGAPLALSLVSDFEMPAPPPTEAKVKKIFIKYISLLDKFGLTSFFNPVEKHVTLSTQAGVNKPAQAIFELAIKRLGMNAKLADCIFITEDAGHILECRKMGIKTLMFDPSGKDGSDFSDWAQAPLMVSALIKSEQASVIEDDANLESALRLQLAALHDLELISMKKQTSKGSIRGEARKPHAVSVSQPDGSHKDVHVDVPVKVDIELDEKGRVRTVESDQPNPDELDETRHYLETLETHQRIAHHRGALQPGETHQEETDEDGRTRVTRKRFSAI